MINLQSRTTKNTTFSLISAPGTTKIVMSAVNMKDKSTQNVSVRPNFWPYVMWAIKTGVRVVNITQEAPIREKVVVTTNLGCSGKKEKMLQKCYTKPLEMYR